LYTDTEITSLNILRSGAPVIGNITSDFNINPNTSFNVIASNISDPENEPLQYKFTLSKSDGTIIDSSNYQSLSSTSFTYTRNAGLLGGIINQIYYFDFYVKDIIGNEVSRRVTITVISQLPTIGVTYSIDISSQFRKFATSDDDGVSLVEPLQFESTITASDPDGGNIVSYNTNVIGGPFNIENQNNQKSIIELLGIAQYTINHIVTDDEGQTKFVQNNINILENASPTISTQQTTTQYNVLCSGYPKRISIIADIADSESLFSSLINPTIIPVTYPQEPTRIGNILTSGSNNSGTITGLFDIPVEGNYKFLISITEQGINESANRTVSKEVDINISTIANSSPSVSTPSSQSFSNPLQSNITFNFTISDPDGVDTVQVLNILNSSGTAVDYFTIQSQTFNSTNNIFTLIL
jgi:hypothetical protein